jgi:hypothetical protein
MSILFAALAGGAYWCTVRAAGEGSGPSMGLMWGLYWVLLLAFLHPGKGFPTQGSFVLLVFVVGFAIGGTQGYGQFNQWMQGRFYLDVDTEQYVPIARVYGFYHLFICGLTWGGIPALLLSWLISAKAGFWVWTLRIFLAVTGTTVALQLVELYPRYFHPLYDRGFYVDLQYCVDCQRTLATASNTYAHLGGFLFPAVFTLWRDAFSRYLILPVSFGFALTFSTGGFLHSLQVVPGLTEYPWWKMWEFTCGLGGGLSLMIAFWALYRQGVWKSFVEYSFRAKPALVLWFGFWMPLFFCIGWLLQDRINQVAKVWNKIYGLDVRDLFDYFETGAVVIAAGMFLYKVYVYYHNNRRREQLLVDRPVRMFILMYSGFFWLIMLRWVYVPFTIEKNIITLLAMSAYLISLVVFYRMRKNVIAPEGAGQNA